MSDDGASPFTLTPVDDVPPPPDVDLSQPLTIHATNYRPPAAPAAPMDQSGSAVGDGSSPFVLTPVDSDAVPMPGEGSPAGPLPGADEQFTGLPDAVGAGGYAHKLWPWLPHPESVPEGIGDFARIALGIGPFGNDPRNTLQMVPDRQPTVPWSDWWGNTFGPPSQQVRPLGVPIIGRHYYLQRPHSPTPVPPDPPTPMPGEGSSLGPLPQMYPPSVDKGYVTPVETPHEGADVLGAVSQFLYGNPGGLATAAQQATGPDNPLAQVASNTGSAFDAGSGLAGTGVQNLKEGNLVSGASQTMMGTIDQLASPLTGAYETGAQNMDPALDPGAGAHAPHLAPHVASLSDVVPAIIGGVGVTAHDQASLDAAAHDLKWASVRVDGQEFDGADHAQALASAEKAGLKPNELGEENLQFGFRDRGGNFVSSHEAQQKYGILWSEQLPQGQFPPIVAYHGTPHDFDQFRWDPEVAGTGEGAQAYGHGLYFAENEGVAKGYRDAIAGKNLRGPEFHAASALGQYPSRDAAAQAMLDRADLTDNPAGKEAYQQAHDLLQSDWHPPGRVYQVGIHADPEHLLDWDKPLNEHHPDTQAMAVAARFPTKSKLADSALNTPSFMQQSGADLLRDLGLAHGSAAEAAAALRDAGIPGIKFLDAGSRDTGDGTRNFVVFDAKTISILKKYGLAGLGLGLGSAIGAAGSPDQAQAAPSPFTLTPVDSIPH